MFFKNIFLPKLPFIPRRAASICGIQNIYIYSVYLRNKAQSNLVDVFGDDGYAQLQNVTTIGKFYITITILNTKLTCKPSETKKEKL